MMCVLSNQRIVYVHINIVIAYHRILLTFSVWMDASIQFDTIQSRWFILCLERSQVTIFEF